MTPEYCDRNGSGDPVILTSILRRFSYYTLTLTAAWTPKEAAVKYDLGGYAASGAQVPESTAVAFGSTVTLAAAPEAAADYVFTGWRAPDGAAYSAGGTFLFDNWEALDDPDAGELTITMTAQYVEKARVTLRFDAAGGTAVAPLTDYAGDRIDLSDPAFATTRTGYDFDGWYNSAGERCEGEYVFTEEETLTAHWKVKQYTITFNSNGGTEVPAVTQDFGTTVTAPEEPEKEHYTFTGWIPALPETMPAEDLEAVASWTPTKYRITFDTDGGSGIEDIEDICGAPVTAPADPVKEGYKFAGWTDDSGNDAEIPVYMPDADTVFHAKWGRIPLERVVLENARMPYTGAPQTQDDTMKVYAEGAEEALKYGTDFTTKYTANTKPGNATVTITGKGKYTGTLKATFEVSFTDVPLSHSYAKAVYWADERVIATGYTDGSGRFGVSDNVTRGQFIMMLWRAAGKPEPEGTGKGFPDVPETHPYYKAIMWAVEKKITTGYLSGSNAGLFGIKDPVKRGQLMTFIWRYAGKPAPQGSTQTFTDVKTTHSFYKAIQWGSEKGLTKGKKDGSFGVNDYCTRGQCVTFLYRLLG